jgi:hypothetical protein
MGEFAYDAFVRYCREEHTAETFKGTVSCPICGLGGEEE